MNALITRSLGLFVSVAALSFLMVWSGSGQTSDFNAMDDDGWTHYDPINQAGFGVQNTWTFPDGGYRLQAAPTPNPALGPGRVASLRQDIIYTNFYVTADVVNWNNNNIQAMGIIARVNEPGPGTTDGYTFGIVTGPTPYVAIARVTNESTHGVGDPAAIALDPNEDYRMEFSGKAEVFRGRVFLLSDLNNPIVTVEGTDASYGSGTAGLVAFNSVAEGVDVTFDNYFGQDHEPPKLTSEVNSLGELIIAWPNDIPDYTLQSSSVLPAVQWMDITTVFNTGARWEYITEPAAGNLFFRLIR